MGPFLTAQGQNGNPADSTVSTNIVEAAKRDFKKPVRKKQPISTEAVVEICQRFTSSPCTLKNLRTLLMFSLGFTGLFRANEPLALKASGIKTETEHLEVLVRKSKTDRYHQGNTVYTLPKLTGHHAPILCSRVFTLLQVSSLDQKPTSSGHFLLW